METRNIPSLPEYVAREDGWLIRKPIVKPMPHGGARLYGGKPTQGQWDPIQRRYIIMYRGKTYKVARLICEAWHGPPPPKAVCMHLNENSSDNRPSNLQWGTQRQNLNAPGFIAYCKTRTGDKNPLRKGRSKAF